MAANIQENKTRRVLHLIGNVVGIAMIAILLPVMIINLTIIIRGAINPGQVPTIFGVAPLIVDSGSMHPEIRVNDLIFVRDVDPDTLGSGDVIAFMVDELVITHRIVGVLPAEDGLSRRFITQGDYTNTPDRFPVSAENVVGIYNGTRLAGVGALAAFLSRPIGMLLFVAVPIALFVGYDLLRRAIYGKKIAQETDAEKEELDRLRALVAQQAQSPAPEVSQEEPQQQQSQD